MRVYLRHRKDSRLLLDGLAETADGGSDGDRGGGVERVSTTRLDLVARAALPNTHSAALHRVLAAEIAEKLGVLRDLLLLHNLAEGSTIAGAVLADDPCLIESRDGKNEEERENRGPVSHGVFTSL